MYRGGATIGSMGSHDPLEAMEITLEVPWSCWCDLLELHTTCSMKCLKEEKDFSCRLKKKEGLPGLDVAVLENYSCIAENEVYGAGDFTFPIELPVMSHSRYACLFC
ncbi:unnamed protein product [Malus baccata var. baccata]